jgi:hypothetical protein
LQIQIDPATIGPMGATDLAASIAFDVTGMDCAA